jgi:16S rRNA (cytidine1402-2'-O)-methyltransferase
VSTLYIVATPIGNLADLSQRVANTLREVSLVLAEDTRRTRGLLTHLAITGKELSRLDAHASDEVIASVIERLVAGESAALVTDAGVPGVSDPGSRLIRAAVARSIAVIPIPGPSAVTAAVSVSGLVEGAFLFLGFLPRQGKARETSFERIRRALEPVVLFESPERIEKTLGELAATLPERRAVVCREITKLHEETLRGTLAELAQKQDWRGEITLVVDQASESELEPAPPSEAELEQEIHERLATGARTREIADDLAARFRLPRRDVYERVEAIKRSR